MAADHHLRDGTAALKAGRWAQARAAFEAALADRPSPEALDGLGEVLWWLGHPRRSTELREQAYAGFRRAGDPGRAVLSALGVAVTYEANFDNGPAAHGWVARAGRLLTGDDDPLAPWVWMIRAYVTRDPAAAVPLSRRALDSARTAGDVDLELCALSGLGHKLVLAGEVGAGLSLVDEAMAGTLGGEWSKLDTVVYTSCDMLAACDAAHDLERATRWCEVADRFIREYGCPFLYSRCRTIYGGLLVATGRWADGERELGTAIEMSAGAGPAVAAEARARLADLRLRQGRVEDASALLQGYEDQARAHLAAAALRLARGDAAGAVTVLRRRSAGTPEQQGPALALLVRARVAQGDLDAARLAAAELAALADGQRVPYAEALSAASTGLVCAATDRPDAAGAAPGRSRAEQPGDRRPPAHQPQDGRAPRQQRAGEARRPQPHRSGRPGIQHHPRLPTSVADRDAVNRRRDAVSRPCRARRTRMPRRGRSPRRCRTGRWPFV